MKKPGTRKTAKGLGMLEEENYPLKKAPRVRFAPELHLTAKRFPLIINKPTNLKSGFPDMSPTLVDRHFTRMSQEHLELDYDRLNHHPLPTWGPPSQTSVC